MRGKISELRNKTPEDYVNLIWQWTKDLFKYTAVATAWLIVSVITIGIVPIKTAVEVVIGFFLFIMGLSITLVYLWVKRSEEKYAIIYNEKYRDLADKLVERENKYDDCMKRLIEKNERMEELTTMLVALRKDLNLAYSELIPKNERKMVRKKIREIIYDRKRRL